jgi:hypothetical protein
MAQFRQRFMKIGLPIADVGAQAQKSGNVSARPHMQNDTMPRVAMPAFPNESPRMGAAL